MQVDRINLKLLHAFLCVAQHRSFRAAATEISRSPSAVSTQIKALEDQLGIALFDRTTRSVALTPEGEQLLDAARRAMHEVEGGLTKIKEAVDMQRGRVSISCSPTVAATRLPAVLAVYEKKYPGVRISVQELTSTDLFGSVRRREVDFGIGPVVGASEFAFETILEEAIYALAPKSLVCTAGGTVSLAELARGEILLLHPATALRSLVEGAFASQNIKLSPKYQFGQAQSLIAAANAGLGSAILPESLLPERPDRAVRVLKIVKPTMNRQIGIITLPGQSLSTAASRLAQLLRAPETASALRKPSAGNRLAAIDSG